MRDDPWLVTAIRIAVVLAGLAVVILGGFLIEGDLLESLYPIWGWLIKAVIGGGVMGLGVGVTVYGINGEHPALERLRLRALRESNPPPLDGGSPPLEDEGGAH
jgi:hypothetical protein